MALNADGLALLGSGLAAGATYAALHDGPASTDEVSTARQAVTWTVLAGNATLSAAESFDGPVDAAVTEVGLWSAVSGGTFYGTVPLTSGDLAFSSSGTYTLTDLDVNFA